MTTRASLLLMLLAATMGGCAGTGGHAPPETARPPREIEQLVAALRKDDAEARDAAARRAGSLGRAAIIPLRDFALEPALADHVKSLAIAYTEIAHQAARPGNEPSRAAIAGDFLALIEDAARPLPGSLQRTLLELVALLADDAATVARVAALLPDPGLGEPACRALARIPGAPAEQALIEHLEHAQGDRAVQVALALGGKHSTAAVRPLLARATGETPLAAASRHALAEIGAADARPALEGAYDAGAPGSDVDLLRFAERRLAQGDSAMADELYGKALDAKAAHVRVGAVAGVGRAQLALPHFQKERIAALIALLADPVVAIEAERALRLQTPEAVVAPLRNAFWTGDPAVRPAALRLLCAADPEAKSAFDGGLNDKDPATRREALAIAGSLDLEGVEPVLLEFAQDAQIAEERAAAIDALLDRIERRLDAGSGKAELEPLRAVAKLGASDAERRRALKMLVRVGAGESLAWLDELDPEHRLADDVARARIAIATGVRGTDRALATEHLERALDSTGDRDLRLACVHRLGQLGVVIDDLAQRDGCFVSASLLAPLPEATAETLAVLPIDPAAPFDAPVSVDGHELRWRPIATKDLDGIFDLRAVVEPQDHVSALIGIEFDAGSGGKRKLGFGSDDSLAVWVNGKNVVDHYEMRGTQRDADVVEVDLAPGTNRLLLRVSQGNGDFGFCARVIPTPPSGAAGP